jgi:hypothetical protein
MNKLTQNRKKRREGGREEEREREREKRSLLETLSSNPSSTINEQIIRVMA